ncbi:MAG: HNH endonuclease [Cyanobacteria bacterium J06635_15]
MVERWRWDQGRLIYFRFENLKKICKVLVGLEGINVTGAGDSILRESLMSQTDLPFAPATYTVWRNYARVFACSLVATQLDGNLTVTDIGRNLAGVDSPEIDVDEYLSFWIPRFYLPSPAFQDYITFDRSVFPLSAVLKYLLANFLEYGEAEIDLSQVFSLIVGNGCDGTESLEDYQGLRPTNRSAIGDEGRQVREMLIFASQMSCLKWYGGSLRIDIVPGDLQSIEDLRGVVEPFQNDRSPTQQQEIIALGRVTAEIIKPVALTTREIPEDIIFTEGRRVRVTHLRTERSPQLRRLFFSRNSLSLCDMCSCDTRYRYPWTDNLLEIHHLLPLSSAITVTGEGTSLQDVVGLCPNCHRSVHIYYKRWFDSNSVNDFFSKEEARGVYESAKEAIQL